MNAFRRRTHTSSPPHAYKFAATLQWAQGGSGNALLYVAKNTGHVGGGTLADQAMPFADEETFLLTELSRASSMYVFSSASKIRQEPLEKKPVCLAFYASLFFTYDAKGNVFVAILVSETGNGLSRERFTRLRYVKIVGIRLSVP